MGMFDTIHLPAKIFLNHPDERLERYAKAAPRDVVPMQTKDFQSYLQDYYFQEQEDGSFLLFKEIITHGEWVEDPEIPIFKGYLPEVDRKRVPHAVYDNIRCYDFLCTDTVDYSVEINVALVAGVITTIECVQFEERDPTARKKMEAETKIAMRAAAAYNKTIIGKTRIKLSRFIRKIAAKVHSLGNFIFKMANKL